MSIRVPVSVQQRHFHHNGYSVLVREWYNPWADFRGRPSWFQVLYVEIAKERLLAMVSGISPSQMDDSVAAFLDQSGIRMLMIENEGFFSKHDINWAVEEAKKRIN